MSGEPDLAARLRRLRREGPPAEVCPPAPAGLPAAMRALLARRAERALPRVEGVDEGPGERRLDVPGELVVTENARGSFCVRERRFPLAHRHGDFRLGEVQHARASDVAWIVGDACLATLDWRAATYLDIETTGLAGGAGTVAFLVALGRFEGDEFVLRQGFLRGPEEEPALLAEVAERVASAGALVSFFGKSFDRHRLEDKMKIHGIAPPFTERAHLDLYHPLRRLYGAALTDARLSTLERALCGVARANDLSGRFAPEAWFDFLGGRAHRLESVFRHNQDDVLSLVVLAAHLGRTLSEERHDGGALAGPGAARAEAVARRLAQERRRAEALGWVERALERSRAQSRELLLLQAELLLTLGRGAEAVELLERLAAAAEDATTVRALVALAKHHEHARGEPEAAQHAVRRALRVARRLGLAERGPGRALERRAERLARRLGRSALAAPVDAGPADAGRS